MAKRRCFLTDENLHDDVFGIPNVEKKHLEFEKHSLHSHNSDNGITSEYNKIQKLTGAKRFRNTHLYIIDCVDACFSE